MAVAALRRGPPAVRLPPARVLLALVLLAWALGEAVWLEGTWPPAARIAFVVAVLAPIAVVDRWPWAVVAILLAGAAVEIRCEVLTQSVSPLQGVVVAGWVAGAAVAGTRRSVAALAAVVAVALAATGWLAPFGVAVVCVLGWAGARATVGVRRRRAEAIDILQAARTTSAELRRWEVDAERRRLAADLDVAVLRAARRIGGEVQRAEALLATDVDAARAALRGIAVSVGEAMGRMREALAVLRADDADDPDGARPDGLGIAVAALRDRGVPVTLHERVGADDRASSLVAARLVEIVGAGGWAPRHVSLRRSAREVRLVVEADGRVSAGERLALTRAAERARLHSGSVRIRRRPRPRRARARAITVRVPLGAAARPPGPGARGLVAGALAAAATALDVVTGHSLPVAPGDEPSAGAIAAASLLTGLAVAGAHTRRVTLLVALAAVVFVRAWIVGFVGLDATTLPLLAFAGFATPLWIRAPAGRLVVAAALAATSAAIVGWAWSPDINGSDLAIIAISIAVPWAIGTAVRDAADEAVRLSALRWATARDDLVAAQEAVDDERRRVARDLHDLVGHGLALISVQAWGAERALPGDPDGARAALATIRRVVTGSVHELERLVAPWGEELGDPLADVIAQARRSGLPVALDDDGVLRSVDGAVSLTLRRIVQEALTNVLRHAGPVPATVRVRADGPWVRLEVGNGRGGTGLAAGPAGGAGLRGMRERAEALGGRLEAGAEGDRFVVRATVPRRPRP